ncbi:hypothetical protein D9M71_404940 [compost metagenome]
MHAQQLADRHLVPGFLLLHGLFHFSELRRVLQVQADVAADQPQRRRQQERNAPAPAVQLFGVQLRVEQCGEQRTEQQPRRRARRHQAGVEAALVVRGVLGEEGRRAGVFPRGGEALHQADQEQQQRRQHARLGVGRQQCDAESGAGHDEDGQGQGVTSAVTITDMAPDDAADGADDEGDREHREGGQKAGGLVGGGEEHDCDHGCQVAVGGIVEPLDEVAHEAGGRRAAEGAALAAGHLAVALAVGQGLVGKAHRAPPSAGTCTWMPGVWTGASRPSLQHTESAAPPRSVPETNLTIAFTSVVVVISAAGSQRSARARGLAPGCRASILVVATARAVSACAGVGSVICG